MSRAIQRVTALSPSGLRAYWVMRLARRC
jgi:hypothetical protein